MHRFVSLCLGTKLFLGIMSDLRITMQRRRLQSLLVAKLPLSVNAQIRTVLLEFGLYVSGELKSSRKPKRPSIRQEPWNPDMHLKGLWSEDFGHWISHMLVEHDRRLRCSTASKCLRGTQKKCLLHAGELDV